nr:hypothetical protein BgiMline_033637 [Biomphalaria glabrata]
MTRRLPVMFPSYKNQKVADITGPKLFKVWMSQDVHAGPGTKCAPNSFHYGQEPFTRARLDVSRRTCRSRHKVYLDLSSLSPSRESGQAQQNCSPTFYVLIAIHCIWIALLFI